MHQFLVEDEVIGEIESREGIDLREVGDVAMQGHGLEQVVPVVLDGTFGQGGLEGHVVEVRELDVTRHVVLISAELMGLVVVGVQFQHGGHALVVQIDAIVADAHFLREVVGATILTIDIEFDGHDMIGSGRSGELGNLHSDCI